MTTKLTKLKFTIIAILVAITSTNTLIAVSTTFATDNKSKDSSASSDICENTNIPKAIRDANGCKQTGDQLPNVIINILNAIILVSGIIAVIFIVHGGISYMTSTGDAGKVKKAKDTILSACIGLIVCVLSFAIVNWVITDILEQ